VHGLVLLQEEALIPVACVSADGALTDVARAILKSISTPRTHEAAAAETCLPLFRVRASVREMVAADMIVQREHGLLSMTEKGREVLELG